MIPRFQAKQKFCDKFTPKRDTHINAFRQELPQGKRCHHCFGLVQPSWVDGAVVVSQSHQAGGTNRFNYLTFWYFKKKTKHKQQLEGLIDFFFLPLGFYFHPFWWCFQMQLFGLRSRFRIFRNQSEPSSLWGGKPARTQTRCRWGDCWWWVWNIDWQVHLFTGAGFAGVRSIGMGGGGHAGIHRMSLAIIALSLVLSSSDSPHIPSVCFHEQRICFSCLPHHSLTLPLGSRGSAQPAGQSRSLVSGFLSLWAAEVVWLLIAVCQRDLGSQSKWPISKDEPKLIC